MRIRYLFFPFTHLTGDQLDIIQAFFPSFGYLPLKSRSMEEDQKGSVELRDSEGNIIAYPFYSPKKDIEAVEQTALQYFQWADMHKDNKNNLKALLKESPYFTSDTDISNIKSVLLRSADKEAPDENSESKALQMLLFLKMAQACDSQNEQIDMELKNLKKTNEELFHTLKGIEENQLDNLHKDMGVENVPSEDLGQKMTHERIAAWSGYMASRGMFEKIEDNSVFVTTSQAVFDYIQSNFEQCANQLDIGWIKVHENKCKNQKKWQEHLNSILVDAALGKGIKKQDLHEADDDCSLEGRIKFGVFSGNEITNLFNMSCSRIAVCMVKLKR